MVDWTKGGVAVLVVMGLCLVEGGASVPAEAAQDEHAQMTPRGQKAMGFDQTRTSHHFYLYEDGGAIEVTVKDRSDKANLAAIRTHLPHIVQLFAKGDFSTPSFIHAQGVPGTENMQRLRDRIAYTYEDIRDGGRVQITTRHARALGAVYEFLRFQIQDHKTGDSLEVARRGRVGRWAGRPGGQVGARRPARSDKNLRASPTCPPAHPGLPELPALRKRLAN